MSKNDDKILKLKEQIEQKKAEIGKVRTFAPITSCSLEVDGSRYNLHVADEDTLVYLLCKLTLLGMAADKLGYTCRVSGYAVGDWMEDIETKLNLAKQKAKIAELKATEAKLDKLLSDEKKTELELADIEAMLK